MAELTCPGCGQPLTPMKGPGRPKRWCSNACHVRTYRRDPTYRAQENAKSLASARAAADAKRARQTDIRICDCTECGRVFVTPVRRAPPKTVCSARCQYRRNRRQKPSERKAEEMRRYRERNPEKFKWSAPTKRASAERRKARRRGAAVVEAFTKADIFERDRWRCQLCRRTVNPKLRYPNPRSASLDHIVPLCDGGDHVASNVQLAHLVCNMKKHTNTGPAGDQLRLIG